MIQTVLKTKNVILALVLIFLPSILAVGQYLIIGYTSLFPSLDPLQLAPLFYFAALGEFLVGYVIGDLYVAKYRQTTKKWAEKLPDAQRVILWNKRASLWFSAAVLFIAAFVLDMVLLLA